jgi:hypothetical protein
MNAPKSLRPLLLSLGLSLLPVPVLAQEQPATAKPGAAVRDGQRDFDFHLGTWKTHLKRRLRPLTGSDTWTELKGTTVVRKVWSGRANLVELVAKGP